MVSDRLLDFASENYRFDKSTLHFITGSTNQVYAFKRDGVDYILRFADRPDAASIRQVKAEMDWLYFLSKSGIGVSLPLAANSGELAFSAQEDGRDVTVASFEVVPGQFWNKNDPNFWNEKIFFNWGKVMGDIHRLTKSYKPANDEDVRGVFTGREAFRSAFAGCPSISKIAEDLIAEMMALPKDADSYGLIHYDIHPWNFLIDGEKINVFDFDDSLYGWFALDIGIALYHGLWWGRKDDATPVPNDFTEPMIRNFIKGYLSANPLSDFWLEKIPMFMKFRQLCKLSWFYDPDNIDEHTKERIANIENDVLFDGCSIESVRELILSKE